jgi:uncharacterized protein (TIGR01777 family)
MEKTKILIAGASGLIGQALLKHLKKAGFNAIPLLRTQKDNQPFWDIEKKEVDLKECQNPQIVINLCGENIAQGRWTKSKKQRLIDSRLNSTKLLTHYFSKQTKQPSLFINASAIGFYGESGMEPVTESAKRGSGFISKLASDWEEACNALENSSTRLVKLRTGIVLSKEGGALAKMLPIFKLGFGGKVGSGKQMMSWIDIDDLCNAVLYIIENKNINGAINLTAPNPVSNQHFSQVLAKKLHRPCLFSIPEFVIKTVFGEMGEDLLLSSSNIIPEKLMKAGFEFEFETIEKGLGKILARK